MGFVFCVTVEGKPDKGGVSTRRHSSSSGGAPALRATACCLHRPLKLAKARVRLVSTCWKLVKEKPFKITSATTWGSALVPHAAAAHRVKGPGGGQKAALPMCLPS